MFNLTFGTFVSTSTFTSSAKAIGMNVKVEKKEKEVEIIPEHLKGMIWASNTGVKHHPVWKMKGVRIVHHNDWYQTWDYGYITMKPE